MECSVIQEITGAIGIANVSLKNKWEQYQDNIK
jgi:hypothetical protein